MVTAQVAQRPRFENRSARSIGGKSRAMSPRFWALFDCLVRNGVIRSRHGPGTPSSLVSLRTAGAERKSCMERNGKRDVGVIQSVDRAISLLEKIASSGSSGISLSDLSRRTGLMPSTAYRLLATLVRRRYLRKDDNSHRYLLGPALHVMSINLGLTELATFSLPYLNRLTETSRETANLAIATGTTVIFVKQIPSTQLVRAVPSLGLELPVYATASGKAILAASRPSMREEHIRALDFVPFTKTTLRSRPALEAALEHIRRTGYATDNEEMEVGGKCVAAAVLSPEGDPIGAISITGPAVRMTPERAAKLGRLIVRAAKSFSAELSRRRASLQPL